MVTKVIIVTLTPTIGTLVESIVVIMYKADVLVKVALISKPLLAHVASVVLVVI